MIPEESYEVWERLPDGTEKRRHPGDRNLPLYAAEQNARKYNKDEHELRRMEMRKTGREYFVVKATTNFEELGAEAQVDEPAPANVTFFFTRHTPHKWSSGPTVIHGDPDNHYLPIETLERAKELAEDARRGEWGDEDLVTTTYGVKAETKTETRRA